MSLRGSKTTEAISQGIENEEIAAPFGLAMTVSGQNIYLGGRPYGESRESS